VPFKDIAELIARRLNVPLVAKTPEEAADHFGWFTLFAGMDAPTSSALTQQRLAWRPVQPDLLTDLDREQYFST
jgi:hypothetical protein